MQDFSSIGESEDPSARFHALGNFSFHPIVLRNRRIPPGKKAIGKSFQKKIYISLWAHDNELTRGPTSSPMLKVLHGGFLVSGRGITDICPSIVVVCP